MVDTYTKPHLTVVDQIELLRSRGLEITDSELAARTLEVVGYYRLSGYWYPYRTLGSRDTRADRFDTAVSFEQIIRLYDFDRRLKLLVLDALERVEIAMRFRVGYTLGRRGVYAHLDPTALDGRFVTGKVKGGPSEYGKWREKMLKAQESSREDFVKHFRQKYDGKLPVWVATELLDFGALSFLYSGLKRPDRDEIALSLSVSDGDGRGTAQRWPTGCTC